MGEETDETTDDAMSRATDGATDGVTDGATDGVTDRATDGVTDEVLEGDAWAWQPGQPGVLVLPSGRLIRGRGLRRPLDPAAPTPAYGVYLLGKRPQQPPWESRWIHWPDFRIPADHRAARATLTEAWHRAADARVEIACGGGRGRTGTALACLAVLDGVPPLEAVEFVRRAYDRRAVETPWQRRYVRRFGPAGETEGRS